MNTSTTLLFGFGIADFLKMLPESTKGKLKEQWDSFGWEKAEIKYKEHMYSLYGTTRILGKPDPVELEGIFTDVYILDKPSAYRRYDISLLHEDPEKLRNCKRHNGVETVKKYDRLFILGKPGAGKTTFLKYITLQAITGELKKIPIFVSLKEWADSGLELMAFLELQFKICQFPDAKYFIEYILKSGYALVLFDGLDEVQQADDKRQRMTQALQNFSSQYLSTQCLITCRIAATDYSFDQFTYMEMADFSDKQMQTFVEKWFCDNETKKTLFLDGFEKEEHRSLRELGSTPLLLSLLCLSFEETMHFPIRRVEIYEEAIEALLKKWDSSRNIVRDEIYRNLSIGRKRQLFSNVAAQTFNNNEYFIEQKKLEKQLVDYIKKLPSAEQEIDIDGEQLLKAIEAQHGIFVERARQIYSFSHLTFQEYFTAKYIVDNNRYKQLIQDKKLEGRYQEVFLLTASMLDDADAFFEVFLQENWKIISKYKNMVALLKWVNTKTLLVQSNKRVAGIRLFYLFLSLQYFLTLLSSFDFVRTIDPKHSLDLDVILARRLARTLGASLDFNLVYSIDPDLALSLSHSFELTRSINITHVFNFAHTLSSSFNLDFDLTHSLTHSLENSLVLELPHELRVDYILFIYLFVSQ